MQHTTIKNFNLLFQRGREHSAAAGLSPAEDSGGKCTHQGAQDVPTTAGV